MHSPLDLRLLGVAVLLVAGSDASAQAAKDAVTDPRDGHRYPVVSVGGLRWFAENLRYRTPDSRCYESDEANCEDHGRLYRLEDALKAWAAASSSAATPASTCGTRAG
jgi:hypothetical protein